MKLTITSQNTIGKAHFLRSIASVRRKYSPPDNNKDLKNKRAYRDDCCIGSLTHREDGGIRDPFVPAFEGERVPPDDIQGTLHVAEEICNGAVREFMEYDK
ncbi:MAG: hypothetical protein ABFC24_07720 [Methanoregulaceae archaeon]